jgi:hypothetical protein
VSTQLDLDTSASCVLDENGNGTASAGPGLPGVSWDSGAGVAVSVTTNANEALCSVYLGIAPAPGSLQGTTSTGSTGDSTTTTKKVWPGQSLIAVWTGGDPGSVATMAISGTRQVP